MIKGMARAAVALQRDDFAESASAALDFVRATMWQNGRLRVTARGGEAALNGYLDDYAFLAEGIVELLQARWRDEDLTFAVAICDAMLTHFEDAEVGGFFFTSHDHEKLLHRPKSAADDAIPAGNAAAIRTLAKLGALLGESRYLAAAEKSLTLFADALQKTPSVHAATTAALQSAEPHPQIIIRPANNTDNWQSKLTGAQESTTLTIPKTAQLPNALSIRKPKTKTIAYICKGTQCTPPIDSVEELKKMLTSS